MTISAAQKEARKNFGVWKCSICGKEEEPTARRRKQKYCSKECMGAAYRSARSGASNPNYSDAGNRVCEVCGKHYFSYQKVRRFCSLKCSGKQERHELRTNAKKDANHHQIVDVLKQGGIFVIDLSRAMYGVPDLLVCRDEKWHLIEIKNPNTKYGRKGLNNLQKKWAEDWKGGPVFVIRTEDEARQFVAGEFDLIEQGVKA